MSKKLLGIDIGSDMLKLAVWDGSHVRRLAAVPLPEGVMAEGRIADTQALSRFIRDTVRAERIGARNVALVLPQGSCFTQRLAVSEMTEQQLLLNLPYEFRDYIDEDSSRYYFDYALIRRGIGDGEQPVLEIMAACTAKETIREYTSLLQKAGLTLKIAVPPAIAAWNVLRRYEAFTDDHPSEYCFIDFGHAATRMLMFSTRALEAERAFDTALGDLDRTVSAATGLTGDELREAVCANTDGCLDTEDAAALFTRCGVEAGRAVNFYFYSDRSSQLRTAWACGGGALLPQLTDAVREELGLELLDAAELCAPGDADQELFPLCVGAVGAAITI